MGGDGGVGRLGGEVGTGEVVVIPMGEIVDKSRLSLEVKSFDSYSAFMVSSLTINISPLLEWHISSCPPWPIFLSI